MDHQVEQAANLGAKSAGFFGDGFGHVILWVDSLLWADELGESGSGIKGRRGGVSREAIVRNFW